VVFVIDALSNKITSAVTQNMKDIDEEKAEVINYGLNILIYQVLLTGLIFALALITGIFKYVLISVIVYASIRIFAGGAHARTRIRCSISSIFTFLLIPVASKYLQIDSIIPAIAALGINLITMYIYAPADTLERPIISKQIRTRQKVKSIVVVAAIFIVSLVVRRFDIMVYNLIIITSLFPSFMLTPVAYKMFGCSKSPNAIDINN
jgi:accessory gene regulator B